MISAAASTLDKDPDWIVALLKSNKISLSSLVTLSFVGGHPWYSGRPGTSGHLSSLSGIPSPSLSGQGQPLFSLVVR